MSADDGDNNQGELFSRLIPVFLLSFTLQRSRSGNWPRNPIARGQSRIRVSELTPSAQDRRK